MIKLGPINKLGTTWWFEFFNVKEFQKDVVEEKIFEVMEEFEGQYSRFRKDSLLCTLNRDRVLKNPSGEMKTLLKLGLEAYKETGGVFNMAVGEVVESTGYDAGYSFQSTLEEVLPGDLEELVVLGDTEVRLVGSGKLDFGGFGKGFLIDKLAGLFKNHFGFEYFLINGGGDMYVTTDEYGRGITIGISNPHELGTFLGTTVLSNQAFAASSPVLRSWKDQDGKEHTHLVGEGQKRSVFLKAPTAVEADIWATTLAIDEKVAVPKTVNFITSI